MRGTTNYPDSFRGMSKISIHVPREGDDMELFAIIYTTKISIHVPREGDDLLDYTFGVGIR